MVKKKGAVENNIKALRKSVTGLTQQELADRVGATRQTIIAIEAGKYAPSLELAFKIVQVFDVSFETVFTYIAE